MGTARYEVEAEVGRDLTHSPYLLDGLATLADAGSIRLRIRPRPPRRRERVRVDDAVSRQRAPYPWWVLLIVRDGDTGSTRRVAVDLQDWRDLWSHSALSGADVVLRRMLTAREAHLVEAAYGVTVRPAGLTGRGDVSRWAHHRAFRWAGVAGRVEAVLADPGRLWTRRSKSASAPPPADRAVPDLPEHYAFFQVAHHDWPGSTSASVLNHSRAELIRALREGLGPRFVGGMTFAGEAPADLADCRSVLPTERRAYLDLVRRASVVVCGNGFGGSPPWKLVEYLEAGACIVAEPLETSLPEPLEDDVHLRQFADPAQAVDRCRELLDRAEDRERLGRGALAFHRASAAPDALARRVLRAAADAPCPA